MSTTAGKCIRGVLRIWLKTNLESNLRMLEDRSALRCDGVLLYRGNGLVTLGVLVTNVPPNPTMSIRIARREDLIGVSSDEHLIEPRCVAAEGALACLFIIS